MCRGLTEIKWVNEITDEDVTIYETEKVKKAFGRGL